jgi:ubiquinone/menaquinone biosynthesis C-methylase UbiE
MPSRSIAESPDAPARDHRERLHASWSSVAGAWERYADEADERGVALSERMLEAAAVRPGAHVLELACGPGGLGLAAAQRVGPDGSVVVSDVAAEMTAIAGRRAAEGGLRNVAARVIDLDAIGEADASYDAVLCREGLMFALEPADALREIARVLRPGGRVAIAVWGPRERNAWLGVVFDAASAVLGAPVPPPGVPGPFSLSDADRLAALLDGAGLAGVAIEDVAVPLRAASFEAWWARTTALAGPLARRLAALPDEAAAAIRERARVAALAYATPDGLELPGLALLASAQRP